MELDASLINALDKFGDHSSISADTRQFLDSSLQISVGDFFMHVFAHFCTERAVFHVTMSTHWKLFMAMACQQNKDPSRVIVKKLDSAWILLEVRAINNYKFYSYSSSIVDGNAPGVVGARWSQWWLIE